MTVIIFIAVLFVLILVHEWGHFIVAKKTGMRVDEFGIGFPPKLFGIKKGETEYTINAFPIGGFVRIFGEDGAGAPSSPVSSEDEKPDTKLDAESGLGGAKVVNLTNSADTSSSPVATQEVNSENTTADHSRSFASRPKWAQALVLIAGVTMNIIFAWFLFVVAFMIGVPTAVNEDMATEDAKVIVTTVLPDSPADGILPSQVVISEVAVADTILSKPTASEFSDFVSQYEGREVAVTYEIADMSDTVYIMPTTGVVPGDDDKVAVGVALTMVDTVSLGFFDAVKEAAVVSYRTLTAICVGLWGLLSDTFVGQADFSSVAGPVGIAGLVGEAAAFGFTSLLTFTAIISLNLAIINMLPFPALDGGRLLFVGIETVTRRQIDPVWTLRLNLLGFVLLIALMIAVTYNDIIKII